MFGPLFDGIQANRLARARRAVVTRSYDAGETIFHEEDPGEHLFVIESGQVRVWRSSRQGVTTTVHMMGPGDAPGGLAALRGVAFPANATAVTPTKLFMWPAAWACRLLSEDGRFAANAVTMMGEFADELLNRLHEVSTERVPQRVARALVRLAAASTDRDASGPKIEMSRQGLADLSATTLYTASRIISRWEAEGLVESGRGFIRIKRLDLLAPRSGIDFSDHKHRK